MANTEYDGDPRRPRAPALPVTPNEYDRNHFDRMNNVLRLYFEQLNTGINYLLASKYAAENSTENNSTTPLGGGGTFTGTGEINFAPDVMVSCQTDQEGTLYFQFSVDNTNWTTFPTAGFKVSADIHEFHVAVKGPRYFRVKLVNDSASAQTYLRLKTYYGEFRQPNAPFNQPQSDDADAIITRSTDPGTELKLGLRSDQEIDIKFGRNPDVDTGTPEDVCPHNGDYTGHDGTANEEIAVVSDNAADAGTVVSSGTATGGSATTLIDTGATFSTDGVAVGDCVVNTTDDSYGFVTSVDSETQLTVREMHKGDLNAQGTNESGDSYQVVTPASTGAAVVRVSKILDEDFVRQDPVYMVMNGTTTVTTSGVNCFRASRMQVISAGTGEANLGTLTFNQATTTAAVLGIILPDYSQTTQCADSVPKGYRALIKRATFSITKSGGSAGSGTLAIRARTYGGPWRNLHVVDIQTGGPENLLFEGGLLLHDHTDFKVRVLSVSGTNTVADASMEVVLVRNRDDE